MNIIAGETLFIEIQEKKDGTLDLKFVEKIENPERTMTFKLEQNKGKPSMILKVTNPYKKSIKYSAFMHTPGNNRFVYTSSCSVKSGLPGFELWPHPIYQFALQNFKVVSDDYNTCE